MAARSAASGGIIPDRGEAERAGQCARLFPRPSRTGRCQRMWPMSKELPGWACRRCRRTRDQRLRLAPDGPAPGGLKWRAPWTWWVKSCRPGLQEGPGPGDRHLGAVHREDRRQQVGGPQFGQLSQLVLHRRFAAHDGDVAGALDSLPFQHGAVAGQGGVVLEEGLARARARSGRSVTATGIPTQTRGLGAFRLGPFPAKPATRRRRSPGRGRSRLPSTASRTTGPGEGCPTRTPGTWPTAPGSCGLHPGSSRPRCLPAWRSPYPPAAARCSRCRSPIRHGRREGSQGGRRLPFPGRTSPPAGSAPTCRTPSSSRGPPTGTWLSRCWAVPGSHGRSGVPDGTTG